MISYVLYKTLVCWLVAVVSVFQRRQLFFFTFYSFSHCERMNLEKWGWVYWMELRPMDWNPERLSPNSQLLKSCDGVEEGPTLTVRLMRSEMPQVGLAARTIVTVIGWAPQFLRESNKTEESTPLLRHSDLVGLGWACKSVFLMFLGGSEAAILLAFPALPTSVLGLMLKNPSSNANSGSYACWVIP